MRTEIRYYTETYGAKLTEEQIDGVLKCLQWDATTLSSATWLESCCHTFGHSSRPGRRPKSVSSTSFAFHAFSQPAWGPQPGRT
jgi:hypothetical protein